MANKKESKKIKKYIAAQDFMDLEDDGKVYLKGDTYPKPANKTISESRIKELLSSDNRQGRPVIEEMKKDQD